MNKRTAKFLLVLGLVVLGIAGFVVGTALAVEHGHGEVEVHEAAGGGHAEHGHGEHHYGRDEWFDLLWRTINFALFAIIIYKAASKPLGNVLKHREEAVRTKLEELEREKQKAHQVYLEYEAKLAQLDKEKEKIIQEFIALGEAEKQKIIEMAQKTAEQIKEGAKRAAEQEVKKAKNELRVEVAEMAAQLAEEIIKQNFKPEDQKKLIEEYLAKLT
ncbi:MAG: ATP synthase F0 subunit B [Candidatus Desulfofervidaceae bacterium]|nr:ATP synthase F0 subunit B [Candidatus Desulfofervidaceae bacterium]